MLQDEYQGLTNSLANTPASVRRLAEGLSESETRWKPANGNFSVVENVCHLRDIELDGYAVRIKRILREDQPFLSDLNGARLAEERDYNNQELKAALDTFAQARDDNVRLIRGLSSEQLARTGMFENTGAITLRGLLELMREHDDAHIDELTKLRDKLAQLA